MITDRLMSVGEWSLELVSNAPTEVRRAFDWGTVVFVTPTRFDRSVSITALQSKAVYAGLVFRQANGLRRFGGPGLLGYLQTGRGEAGAPAGAATVGPITFAAFLALILTGGVDSNGLDVGTAHSATATTLSLQQGTYNPPTKGTMDTTAALTGNEYRVLPDGTIDYGAATSLFRSTPTVAVAPGMKGADAGLRVLESTSWMVSRNIDNYRNGAFVASNDGSYSIDVSAYTSAVAFKNYTNTGYAKYTTPLTTLQTDDTTEVSSTGTAMSKVYASATLDINCSVREYCLPRFVTPGDWIYVYSVEDDLTDTANQVVFQGQTLFPKKVRCVGYTYPIESGMGVFVYDTTAGTVTDVSDYVAWETGRDTSLELDSKPLSILDAATRSVLL